MKSNIADQTDRLASYFSQNRISWDQFYESERVIIGELQLGSADEVLDLGCGCAGLGLALRKQFGVERYTGVEINPLAAEAGKVMYPEARILCGDMLDISRGELHGTRFDAVFSLSCVDWNVQFGEMLDTAWKLVAQGGHLVATFRLTDGAGCDDIHESYQHINFNGVAEGERASYVVLDARALMRLLARFEPFEINAFGYWGTPSASAVTPYERLCFSAFSIRKRRAGEDAPTLTNLKLPPELLRFI